MPDDLTALEVFRLRCIDLVALHGGPVGLEAAIRSEPARAEASVAEPEDERRGDQNRPARFEVSDGVLVLCFPHRLSAEAAEQIRVAWQKSDPGRKIFILDDGASVVQLGDQARLTRIESKLDALLAALAEEESGAPSLTLDGDSVCDERQKGLSLD